MAVKKVTKKEELTIEAGGGELEVSNSEVLDTREVRVGLNQYLPVELGEASKLVVKNIGFGDLFVTNELTNFTEFETIMAGEEVEFTTSVVLYATTVQTAEIKFIK